MDVDDGGEQADDGLVLARRCRVLRSFEPAFGRLGSDPETPPWLRPIALFL
jgi:hypothetical protein